MASLVSRGKALRTAIPRIVIVATVLAYSGNPLDRAAGRRSDDAWLAAALADPRARVLPMWRDLCLVDGDRPVTLTGGEADVFLGLDGDVPVFAVDLSALDEADALAAAGATGTRDVRALFTTLDAPTAAAYGQARGLLHWHRNQRFCGACGGPTAVRQGGNLRACEGCGKLLFPRIEPAVITLVESADRCLLARHGGAPAGGWSTLAGFVEVGESLEDAVRREVAEESGVRVGEVVYAASQAWPFPAGLMVGFRAHALDESIAVDGEELVEAGWFTRAEVREIVTARPRRPDAIDRYLIETWLSEAP
jgi:NAD+ diphosphatase